MIWPTSNSFQFLSASSKPLDWLMSSCEPDVRTAHPARIKSKYCWIFRNAVVAATLEYCWLNPMAYALSCSLGKPDLLNLGYFGKLSNFLCQCKLLWIMNFRILDFSETWMDLKVHKLRDRAKVLTKSLKKMRHHHFCQYSPQCSWNCRNLLRSLRSRVMQVSYLSVK